MTRRDSNRRLRRGLTGLVGAAAFVLATVGVTSAEPQPGAATAALPSASVLKATVLKKVAAPVGSAANTALRRLERVAPRVHVAPLAEAQIAPLFASIAAESGAPRTVQPDLSSELVLSPNRWKVTGRGSLTLVVPVIIPDGSAGAAMSTALGSAVVIDFVPKKSSLHLLDCVMGVENQVFSVSVRDPGASGIVAQADVRTAQGHVVFGFLAGQENALRLVIGTELSAAPDVPYWFDSCRIVPQR
jgi:hypothetical protein